MSGGTLREGSATRRDDAGPLLLQVREGGEGAGRAVPTRHIRAACVRRQEVAAERDRVHPPLPRRQDDRRSRRERSQARGAARTSTPRRRRRSRASGGSPSCVAPTWRSRAAVYAANPTEKRAKHRSTLPAREPSNVNWIYVTCFLREALGKSPAREREPRCHFRL